MGATLDFIVIGAQKAGTTALWRYLSSHSRLYLPPSKEGPFFSDDRPFSRGFDWYLGEFFDGAPPTALWGTATPHYMMGTAMADVAEIARRIARQLPEVRLIAVLRDPIERARSGHRMSTHRGLEHRSFEQAATELLSPEALEDARRTPTQTNSYLVQGEYGRILGAYLDEFRRDQVHITLSRDLATDPDNVLRRIHAFLGVEHEPLPPKVEGRYFRGGTKRRIDQDGERQLKEYLAREVWPHMPRPREARGTFNFWFYQFNMVPEQTEAAPLEADLEHRLRAHFQADAALLEDLFDLRVPWR